MNNSTLNNGDAGYWHAFLEGDKEAYAGIYRQYFSLLYEYGIRLCRDKEVVKDCIQDLFIKLWVNREHLQQATAIKPYLLIALKSTLLNKLDQMHRMAARAGRVLEMSAFDLHYTTAEESLIHDDEEAMRRQQIRAALDNLTHRQKECIFLRFYIGLEYAEIADTMQISVKASYKIIGRAITVMRKYFKEIMVSDMLLFMMLLTAI
ncbi:MAG: RNA polymerase sigma factor [Chitinophagaceae bacterium]